MKTLASNGLWSRWNPGMQYGAMTPMVVAARLGWFESYAWVALPRTVNGTGHTGPSEFCATSI